MSQTQPTLFSDVQANTRNGKAKTLNGYKGMYAFHKYWGKKPLEHWTFFIDNLPNKGDIVIDPFLGSGLIAREAVRLERRFIGIDINPISCKLAELFVNLPDSIELNKSYENLKKSAMPSILESYAMDDGDFASHYLWEGNELKSVWKMPSPKKRIELLPSVHDKVLSDNFDGYIVKNVKKIELFDNSRINSKAEFGINQLFSQRALRNLDILIDVINQQPLNLINPLMLSLTAISGQVSKMVFAISGRGKTTGTPSQKIEVGSWAIGYWRPDTHFEINVWRVFEKKIQELIQISKSEKSYKMIVTKSWVSFSETPSSILIANVDASKILDTIPSSSIQLVLTDPPHADRIPYLELSSMWNTIIGAESDFENELVVSNAKSRMKNEDNFTEKFSEILEKLGRVIKPSGYLVIMYNSRIKSHWQSLSEFSERNDGFTLIGAIPIEYSSGSIVQDNRSGSLENDYAVVFKNSLARDESIITLLSTRDLVESIPRAKGRS